MSKSASSKPRVKLVGSNSNAFAILGLCREAARVAGWSKADIDKFMVEARSGDYDHLLRTCSEYFDVR